MPSFEYEAIGTNGERVSSIVFGRNLAEVISSLTSQGLQVQKIHDAYSHNDPLRSATPAPTPSNPDVSVHAGYSAEPAQAPSMQMVDSTTARSARLETPSEVQSAPVDTSRAREMPNIERRSPFLTNLIGPLVGRVPLKDLSFFFRQFAAMVEAGVPMVQCLDTLASQSGNSRLKSILFEMRNAVDAGLPISSILQRYPEVFSPLIVSLIRAGEIGGFLVDACKHVSEYLNHEIELRNMYRRETFVPKVQLIAAIAIVGLTNTILSAIGGPGSITAPLNRLSTWMVLGPLLIGIFLFIRIGLANYSIRRAWHAVLLRVPYVGKTLHYFAMAKFGRAFSALYKGGVPIAASVPLAADASGNEYIRSKIAPTVVKIQEGEPITATLQATGVFSPIVMNMMATGETTGNLDHMLIKAAEFYEDEGKVRAKQMAVVTGVAVFLCVAIYIGYVVITFWMGYFNNVGNMLDGAGTGN